MATIMNEIFRLIVIGSVGFIISIFNILDKYANMLVGCVVGIATLVFLIFQIVKIYKEIELKNMEICEKRNDLKHKKTKI